MEINDRINQIIEHEHLSVAAFARKIGIGDQTVRSVCVLRRNKPGFEFLSNLIQTFEWLDPKWLLTGEGSMERAKCDSAEPRNNGSLIELIEYLREKDRRIEQLIEKNTELKLKWEIYSGRTQSERL
ncbi:MAG: hypothetical protein BHV67_05300 [Bacteroidales bacterium 43_36]|nr:MAG: hypothetical protein BHV67_05300 [Bacteroidales bacterium 43_36]